MKTKITFTLPAHHIIGADSCVLLGEFNNWNLEEGIYLQMKEDGSMEAEVELEAGRDYEYRYLLSNGRWVNDAGEKVMSVIMGTNFPVENCIVRVPAVAPKEAAAKSKKTSGKKKAAATKTAALQDDLTKVEGIGKKIEALLYKHKIHTYKQLSKASIKSLKEILESGGSKYSMHNPGSWPKQAKLAAEGKWDDLELLQKHLKGGK